jgi:hypothetical protein
MKWNMELLCIHREIIFLNPSSPLL